MVEQTLALIKPDGVMMGVAEAIKARYLDAGLKIAKEKKQIMKEPLVRGFYQEHEGKFFFSGLILSMVSGPSIAILLERQGAIKIVRELNGATDPSEAKRGTIRHDYRSAGGPFNTVHCSDSPEAAAREIEIIFGNTS